MVDRDLRQLAPPLAEQVQVTGNGLDPGRESLDATAAAAPAGRSPAPRTSRRSSGTHRCRRSHAPSAHRASPRRRAPLEPTAPRARRGRRLPRCTRTRSRVRWASPRSSPAGRSARPRPPREPRRGTPPTSPMTWSAANDPMTASGSRRATTAAARPIAGILSRGLGSASRFAAPRAGSCAATASACAVPVTTTTRLPASGARRSHVPCSRVRPDPVRSCRNLGAARRDSGQSRVPAPPAGMTAQKPSMSPATVVMSPKIAGGAAKCAISPLPTARTTGRSLPRRYGWSRGHYDASHRRDAGAPHDGLHEDPHGDHGRVVRALRPHPHVRQPQALRGAGRLRRVRRSSARDPHADPAVLGFPLDPARAAHHQPRSSMPTPPLSCGPERGAHA